MNCKPGDMAVIVEDPLPECVGAVVHVDRPYDGGMGDGRPAWYITPAWPIRCVVADCPGLICPPSISPGMWTYDAWLRPIRGEPEADSITDEQRRLMELPA